MPEKPPTARQTYAPPQLEHHLEYTYITAGPGFSFGATTPFEPNEFMDRLIAWEKITDSND